MKKHRIFMIVLTFVALPSVLYAIGMPGMGGMGTIVDKVYIQTQSVGKVLFTHSLHGTNCGMCHPKIFKQKNNTNHVKMKAMEEGKSCGTCHNGQKAFSVTANCEKCHAGDIIFKDKNIGNITFSHSVHTELLGGCDSCHPDVFKAERGANTLTMKAMENGEFCGACHDGSSAFSVKAPADCSKCHAGDIIFKEKDAGDVTFSHSAHIETLGGCDSCHPDLFKAQRGANKATMADMESGKSCGACHDGTTAFSVADDCEACHKM
jgi:c(7)-type cytochrome triheme protein